MKFKIGQLVYHKLFGYRGVIFGADPKFKGDEAWYDFMARTRPPKDKPWYNVLVDGEDYTTYVAERNLEYDTTNEEIHHPLLPVYFNEFKGGEYCLGSTN